MAVFLLLAGAAGFVWSFVWIQRRDAFLLNAQSAQGRVVEFIESRNRDGATYQPVVRFAAGGKEIVFRHYVATGRPAYAVGQDVPVLFDPADPSNAIIDGGFWNRLAPRLPGYVGAAMFALGLFVLLRRAP